LYYICSVESKPPTMKVIVKSTDEINTFTVKVSGKGSAKTPAESEKLQAAIRKALDDLDISEDAAILKAMGEYLSTDDSEHPAILAKIREVLDTDEEGRYIDDLEYEFEGEEETVLMWEPVEYRWSVREFAEEIGVI
jgi:hypothetical protein